MGLPGEAVTSVNTASGKYYYDRDEGGFQAGLYQAVGAVDLLIHRASSDARAQT